MGIWVDLWLYIRRLFGVDTTQWLLTLASILALVIGFVFVPPWALSMFLGILMASSFRLWRDGRRIQEREDEMFRKIAQHVRDQIAFTEMNLKRSISFSISELDDAYSERVFRKHFPEPMDLIDQWVEIPERRNQARWDLMRQLGESIPGNIPMSVQASLINVAAAHIDNAHNADSALKGRFEISEDSSRLNWRLDPSSATGFIMPTDEGPHTAQEIADTAHELNDWVEQGWSLSGAQLWRSLIEQDENLVERIRNKLTTVIYGAPISRKYCDRSCFEQADVE